MADPRIAATCLISFTDSEEALGLIADTLEALTDSRVVEGLVSRMPAGNCRWAGYPDEARAGEWAAAYLLRTMRLLLPTHGAQDVTRLRCQYGWTGPDLDEITGLLLVLQGDLRVLARDPDLVLDGTRKGLVRQGERVQALIERWNVLRGEARLH